MGIRSENSRRPEDWKGRDQMRGFSAETKRLSLRKTPLALHLYTLCASRELPSGSRLIEMTKDGPPGGNALIVLSEAQYFDDLRSNLSNKLFASREDEFKLFNVMLVQIHLNTRAAQRRGIGKITKEGFMALNGVH